MATLVPPHGGADLRPLLLPGEARESTRARAADMPNVPLSSREVSDLLMLGMGAYTPLDGFMGEADWRSTTTDMRLADGTFWPVPITLSCGAEAAGAIGPGDEVALVDDAGQILGTMVVRETYRIDRDLECRNVFGTTDPAHPGVAKVMAQGEVNLGGPVVVLDDGHYPQTYPGLYHTPAETRALFAERGWARVAAFQTRNPMHRSHEFLAKAAIEVCDGLLIHQVLGALKPGDIPADVRVAAIDALVSGYFAPGTVIQAGYPIEMRYGGPREALLHAVFRQNFGCSHLVVGRDHAGVGDFYGPHDAQRIFDDIPDDAMVIRPLKINETFYCYKCAGMATGATCFAPEGDDAPPDEARRNTLAAEVATGKRAPFPCPDGGDGKLAISGTRLREMFANHEPIPAEYSRPEVVAVLQAYYDRAAAPSRV